MIRVAVSGSQGKTGRVVAAAVSNSEDLSLVGEAERGDDLSRIISDTGAQVVVDFTEPRCALTNTLAILGAGASAVIGTTGFSDDDLGRVRQACERHGRGAIIAPNFALGAVLLMQLAEQVARVMPDAEIVELHHQAKLDKPSGTARMTARRIEAARGEAATSAVPIHSVRLPGLVAHQEVIFGCAGQALRIRHDIHDRQAFVPGVLLAVRRVLEINGLIVGLDRLLAEGG